MFIFILTIIFIYSFTFPCYADAINEIYKEAQCDFNPENILVLIKKEYSEIGKEYSPADFDEELIESVKVLNQINPSDDTSGINLNYWQQSLLLTLKNPTEDNIQKAINTVYDNPKVESASKNYIISYNTYDEESNKTINTSTIADNMPTAVEDEVSTATSPLTTTNDTFFPDQYGLLKTRTTRAWAFTTGSSNVTIGILDSGMNTHRDVLYDTALSKNFTDETGLWDNTNHGTHVAGIIRAQPNNRFAISGVRWNATLVNLKVLKLDESTNEGTGETAWVINAIHYAAQKSIDILNMSLSCNYVPEPTQSQYKAAINAYNGLIVCSAGNVKSDDANDNAINIGYPSLFDCDNIISVASCDSAYNLAPDTKYSPIHVDLLAPGVDIYSTVNINDCIKLSGTSMATPFVTGAAALILSVNPNLSATQIKELILNKIDKTTAGSNYVSSGGVLNTLKAVLAAMGYLLGDVNMDGQITAADARLALQFAADVVTYNKQQAVMADVNYDGFLSASDSRKILRISAQLDEPLNIEQEEIM